MPNVGSFVRCTNCGACVSRCPVDAISVKKDVLFYEIEVLPNCIDCGACIKICPENTVTAIGCNPSSAYGGVHKDDDVVKKSSSGGFFSALSEYVVSSGGVVYGAVYDETHRFVIVGSTDTHTLDDIRRSKYTESLVGNSFRDIKTALRKEKNVLFCGTPCQVAGLKCYLGEEYSNLITCDFVCGGLASHKLYQERLDQLEKENHATITSVNFRAKVLGWGEYTIEYMFDNGKKVDNAASLDPYFWSFLNRKSIRENCYDCSFVGRHFSDFTIADFWQYKELSSLPDNKKGLSLVGVNTEKAHEIISALHSFEILTEVDAETAFPKERKSLNPKTMEVRKCFLEDSLETGLRNAAVAAGFPKGLRYTMERVKYFVKKMK